MAAVLSEEKAHEVLGKEHGAPVDMDEKRLVDRIGTQPYEIGVIKDGMKTHPQPTADPLDPLNWSSAKKHTILAIVMYL